MRIFKEIFHKKNKNLTMIYAVAMVENKSIDEILEVNMVVEEV